MTTCADCAAPINEGSLRCRTCAARANTLARFGPPPACVDCGKRLAKRGQERCRACSTAVRYGVAHERAQLISEALSCEALHRRTIALIDRVAELGGADRRTAAVFLQGTVDAARVFA